MSVFSALERLAARPEFAAPLLGAPIEAAIPKLGRMIDARPDPRLRALSALYAEEAGFPYAPPETFARVGPEDARAYARAYDDMANAPSDPLVAAAWARMGDETLDQLDMLYDAGYRFRFNAPGDDPYAASPRLALEDLKLNRAMSVFPTEEGYGTLAEPGRLAADFNDDALRARAALDALAEAGVDTSRRGAALRAQVEAIAPPEAFEHLPAPAPRRRRDPVDDIPFAYLGALGLGGGAFGALERRRGELGL